MHKTLERFALGAGILCVLVWAAFALFPPRKLEAEVTNPLKRAVVMPAGGDCDTTACNTANPGRQLCREGNSLYVCNTGTGFYVPEQTKSPGSFGSVLISGATGITDINSCGTFLWDDTQCLLSVGDLTVTPADIASANCASGQIKIDTGGATKELCACYPANTWVCVGLAAGPAN
jgi:hypothetical protein